MKWITFTRIYYRWLKNGLIGMENAASFAQDVQPAILYPFFDNGTDRNHFAKLSQHREI